jgi:hypothetical protein
MLKRGNDHNSDTQAFTYQTQIVVAPGAFTQRIVIGPSDYGKKISVTLCEESEVSLGAMVIANRAFWTSYVQRAGNFVPVRNWAGRYLSVNGSGATREIYIPRSGLIAPIESSDSAFGIQSIETVWKGALFQSIDQKTQTTKDGVTTYGGKITYLIYGQFDVVLSGVNTSQVVCGSTVSPITGT